MSSMVGSPDSPAMTYQPGSSEIPPSLKTISGGHAHWVASGPGRCYSLRANSEVCGSLQFARGRSSLATARTSNAGWTFKRVGFFTPIISIKSEESGELEAVFHPRGTRSVGVLETRSGESYLWNERFWSVSHTKHALSGKPVILFMEAGTLESTIGSLDAVSAGVLMEPTAYRLPHLPLMLTLGWYLMLLKDEETVVAAAHRIRR